MDEFIKRLYDFWVFIEFFGVKIVITDIYRYLLIFYQYLPIFTDILPILIQKFLHKHACSTVAIFRWKNRYFSIFRRKIDNRFFLCLFISVPAENRFIDRKNRFFCPWSTVTNLYKLTNVIDIKHHMINSCLSIPACLYPQKHGLTLKLGHLWTKKKKKNS